MAPKVPVVVRVELGKKHHQSGRMHEAEVALSLVVSDALERDEPEIAAGKLTASTVKCFRTTEFSGTGTVLDNEDLGETTQSAFCETCLAATSKCWRPPRIPLLPPACVQMR